MEILGAAVYVHLNVEASLFVVQLDGNWICFCFMCSRMASFNQLLTLFYLFFFYCLADPVVFCMLFHDVSLILPFISLGVLYGDFFAIVSHGVDAQMPPSFSIAIFHLSQCCL